MIFIDELDRCRPDYAVKLLETIKHIFSVKGVCFVLGVDRNQLQKSVEQLYGKIDFENYYLRFVTREATLEEPSKVDIKPFVESLFREYVNEKRSTGIIFPFSEKHHAEIIKFISISAKGLNLTPRQMESFFRKFVHFSAIEKNELSGLIWVKATIVLLLISLKSSELYHSIGLGSDSNTITNVVKFIKEQPFLENDVGRTDGEVLRILMSFMLRESNREV